MDDCRELLERKERECREDLQEYEERWMNDWERWQEDIQKLSEEVWDLKRVLAQREAELSRLRLEAEERERKIARLQRDMDALRALLRRPPLGEGFFHRLEAHLNLLDGSLLQEARGWTVQEVQRTLGALGEERKMALESLLSGEAPDWKRLWTGLLLEWALWAWLEGGDG